MVWSWPVTSTILGTNWQRSDATSVAQGDFNGDGLVAAADLNDIGLFWQHGVAAAADASAVPEPSSAAAGVAGDVASCGPPPIKELIRN